MKTKIIQNLKLIILALILGVGVGYVYAWTGPTALAPESNVPAPINTGGRDGTDPSKWYTQVKTGILSLAHLITADLTVTDPDPEKTITPGQVLTAEDSTGKVVWGNAVAVNSLCPSNQYLIGFDGEGKLICSAVSNAPIEYYFGGMYGGGSTSYTNPVTGAKTCPTGYNAFKVAGTVNLDYNLYYCLGRSDQVSRVAWFGGMYGYGGNTNESNSYTNPIAGNTKGCSAGYTDKRIHGIVNVDYNLHLCYSLVSNTPPVTYKFYGMYGAMWNGSSHTQLQNPVSGVNGCGTTPSTSKVTYGTTNVDYQIGYCYSQNP